MSNEENPNESANESEDLGSKIEETVDEAVESVSETKDNIASKAMDLKESNPKFFFGGIAAIVLILLVLIMSGGSNKKPLPAPRVVNLVEGQTYQLKGVNTYDPEATIRLVSVPGSMAAYDDTEEDDRSGECQHMPQQTKVKLRQLQEITGAKYAQVEIIDGKCAGKKGWVVANNLN